MSANGWMQIGLFALALFAVTAPLGAYLHKVYDGSLRWFAFLEHRIYRIAGIDPLQEQHWSRYAGSMLMLSAITFGMTYLALRLQSYLPANPAGLGSLSPRQAFETAVAFTTNTNWQSYSGESTMSYFSQATQLAFHNFLSAAVGMSAAVAFVRGLARRSAGRLGNFWVDTVRGVLYVLLPISLILALLFVQQGVVQNFKPYVEAVTLEGVKQTIPMGPVASQETIKQLGTNGGGFFNANSAHPFENPTPFSNFWQMFAILMIPSAMTFMMGKMVNSAAHGWAVWSAMFLLLAVGTAVTYKSEAGGNPIHAARGIDVAYSAQNPGGNMEGKEVRFGTANSALFATVTTAASCGAVNAMHDSFSPLGGLVPMVNMQLGEVVFGGVGAGLYGMLMMVIVTVFVAGLMVGRTPEYLGKKIQAREVQMAVLYVLIFPAVVLSFTALAAVLPAGLAALNNRGPHGLSEILYAFSSAAANNGSAFAGLSAATPFYSGLLGVAMLVGRFAMMVPMLALAGFLSEKQIAPQSSGTFPVTTPLFVALLIGVILIVGALTFFPAISLGALVEHLSMNAGRTF